MKPVAWEHSYRRVSGGKRYQEVDYSEPPLHPDPQFGFEWVGASPLFSCPQLTPVPDGWQLVPKEPTWEMVIAGCAPGEVVDNADMARAYKAMLASSALAKEKSE